MKEEIEPGYYVVEIVYDKKEIGKEGYGIILSYRGNEEKDFETLMRNIVYSKEITLNTDGEVISFLENLLENEDIKILNRDLTKEYLSDLKNNN